MSVETPAAASRENVKAAVSQIDAAFKSMDIGLLREGLTTLENELDAGVPVTGDEISLVLKRIRGARAFEDLTTFAQGLLLRGMDSIEVRRAYAQALIEGGNAFAAIDVLNAVINRGAPADAAGLAIFKDCHGIMGRAYKQLYVDAVKEKGRGLPQHLTRSIGWYAKVWNGADPAGTAYHGINVIALLARAAKDGVEIPGAPDYRDIARQIIGALEGQAVTSDNPWDGAILGEAYVALEAVDKAARWFGVYANHEHVDAFAIGGSLRQLEEVWNVEASRTGPGAIVSALKAKLSEMNFGQVQFSNSEIESYESARVDIAPHGDSDASISFEGVLHGRGPTAIDWLLEGAQRARSVARIQDTFGDAWGTGFVVVGRSLHPSLGEQPYLVTNAHVLCDEGSNAPVCEARARLKFERVADLPPGTELKVHDLLWSSPPNRLDTTITAIDVEPGLIPALEIADDDMLPSDFAALERMPEDQRHATVIGHPGGRDMAFSLDDTLIVDIGYRHKTNPDDIFLHYKCPTEPGNSGSPIFLRKNWALVGIHHAGPRQEFIDRQAQNANKRGGVRKLSGKVGFNWANQGIALSTVRRALAAELEIRGKTYPVRTPNQAATAGAGDTRDLDFQSVKAGDTSGGTPDVGIATGAPSRTATDTMPISVTAPRPQAMAPGHLPGGATPLPDEATIQEAVWSLATPEAELRHLLMLDAARTRPFRPAVVPRRPAGGIVMPPAMADLDAEMDAESVLRASRMRRRSAFERAVAHNRPPVLAAGDGWIHTPFLVDDIVDHLLTTHAVTVYEGGDGAMAGLAQSGALLDLATRHEPMAVILSAGGATLLTPDAIADAVVPGDDIGADGTRILAISRLGRSVMQRVATDLDHLVGALWTKAPRTRVLVHGYMAPPVTDPDGPYARRLVRAGIRTPAEAAASLATVVDGWNRILAILAAQSDGRLVHVDVRDCGTADGAAWTAPTIPSAPAFEAMAARFRMALDSLA